MTAIRLFDPSADGVPDGPLTVGQVLALYSQHGMKSASERSLKERQHLLATFGKDFGSKVVSSCRPADLLLWVNAHPAWKSDWTIKRVIATVQGPFNWAAKLGFIDRNPFSGISHEQGEPGRAMANEEFGYLLRNSSAEFRRVLIYLRYTGCRPGEMSSLEWGFVDLQRGIATLFKHKTAHSRRDRKPRVIILHPVLVKLIAWIKRNGPHPTFVFVNSKRRQWTRYSLALRVKRLRKKLNLDPTCRLYGLRHKFCTDAILNGVPIKFVSEMAGHSSVKTTEHYTHVGPDDLRSAIVKAIRKADHDKPS